MNRDTRASGTDQWSSTIKAVAFDMDGLMVNTEQLYTEVGETIMERRGLTFTSELKSSMMGLPGQQAFQVMIEYGRLADSVETLSQESEEVFAAILPHKLAVLPGLVELFEVLDRKKLPRCVATSSTHRFAAEVLELVGMRARVDFVITAEDVEQGKPHPDIYLAAAERLKVPANEMLVLEDSHHGSRAGVRAGACTIAVPGEHSRDHDFSGVHRQAESLADPMILDVLGVV